MIPSRLLFAVRMSDMKFFNERAQEERFKYFKYDEQLQNIDFKTQEMNQGLEIANLLTELWQHEINFRLISVILKTTVVLKQHLTSLISFFPDVVTPHLIHTYNVFCLSPGPCALFSHAIAHNRAFVFLQFSKHV